MSRHLFGFLNIQGNMALIRRLHILGAYWGFLFVGLHLGIHWSTLMKHFKINMKKHSKNTSTMFFLISIIISIYGIYAFIRRDFLTYLLLKNEFVFMDFNEYPVFFYFDYLMIMTLCIFIAYYGMKVLLNKRRTDNEKNH